MADVHSLFLAILTFFLWLPDPGAFLLVRSPSAVPQRCVRSVYCVQWIHMPVPKLAGPGCQKRHPKQRHRHSGWNSPKPVLFALDILGANPPYSDDMW